MRFIYFLLLIVCFASCQNSATNNANTNLAENKTSPSPKPSLSKEEKEQEAQKEKVELDKAINDFIAKNHPGWQLNGISDEFDCQEDSRDPCNLLLVSGQKEKVIAVMIKRFIQTDSQSKLVVFEARPIDLSKAKIELIKEREKEATIEELDDERAAASIDASDLYDREPYDPR